MYKGLLLYDESTNLSNSLTRITELLAFHEKIFSSSSTAEIFLYFCLNGSATAWALQNELDMPEATVYRTLKRLRALSLIESFRSITIGRQAKGGPRPKIWGLRGCTVEEQALAYRDHIRSLSPKYRAAEKFVQAFLLDFEENDVKLLEIRGSLKAQGIQEHWDVADIAAQLLHEKGIRVWR